MKDKDGKEETNAQRYWRILWSQRPPYARKIRTFYQYLMKQDEKERLSYKLVSESRIYIYSHRFDWNGWKEKENHKQINKRTREKTKESMNYTLNNLDDAMSWFSDFANVIQKEMTNAFQNFDITNPQTSKVSIQLVQLYKEVLNVLSGMSVNLDNTYNIIQELDNEEDGMTPMSNFSKMLKESEERFKRLENGFSSHDE